MKVSSPVTASHNTTAVDEFETARIINLYKAMGINVERFFIGLDKVSLYQCNDTLFRFYYPFTIFGDDEFYQELYTSIPNYYHPSRWEYSYAHEKIKPGSLVLEIGCGAGIFLDKLKMSGSKAEGLELNSKAIADCKAKGLNVHAELIESFAQKNQNGYDVVCSFQVLEHVAEVKSFLTSALTALKPGGKLIISVPNSHPYFLKHDKYHTLNMPPHHSGLWNKTSLEKLTTCFPMRLESMKTEPLKEYKEWYLTQVKYYEHKGSILATFMKLVPRFVYKSILRLFSNSIQGSYITAIFQKL